MLKFENIRVSIIFVPIWFLSFLAAYIWSNNTFIIAFLIFYTGILPFLYFIILLNQFKFWLSSKIDISKSWSNTIKIFFSWLLFVYSIYAQKWASDVLNSIFFVEASNFRITYLVLTFLYAPFGLIYQNQFISLLFNSFIDMILILPIIMVLYFYFSKKKIVSKLFMIVKFFVMVVLLASILAIADHLSEEKNNLVKKFALWADFDSNYPCSNEWRKNTESLVFIGGDKVLLYQPKEKYQFVIKTCDFEKTF